LRALARELGTSHQLLQHYLDGLEEWECKERYRRANEKAHKKAAEIRASAEAEGREMTMRECFDAFLSPGLVNQIERIRQDAERGSLHHLQFKMLEQLAKHGFPGAQEILSGVRFVLLRPRGENLQSSCWRD
jgi:hypothetical protein